MSKLQKCDKPKIGQKISTRGPPTENFDESMNYTENHRLVRNFGRGASGRDFLAYFWLVAFLEFGHVGHKGLKLFACCAHLWVCKKFIIYQTLWKNQYGVKMKLEWVLKWTSLKYASLTWQLTLRDHISMSFRDKNKIFFAEHLEYVKIEKIWPLRNFLPPAHPENMNLHILGAIFW